VRIPTVEEGALDLALAKALRSYVGRRLFAALGEALFECQRFKSKENESVGTAEGEMAFIAMYIRKQALLIAEESEKAKKR